MPSHRTQNINVLWFVVANSTVDFIDVKSLVTGAVVKPAGKQVCTVLFFLHVIEMYSL